MSHDQEGPVEFQELTDKAINSPKITLINRKYY